MSHNHTDKTTPHTIYYADLFTTQYLPYLLKDIPKSITMTPHSAWNNYSNSKFFDASESYASDIQKLRITEDSIDN